MAYMDMHCYITSRILLSNVSFAINTRSCDTYSYTNHTSTHTQHTQHIRNRCLDQLQRYPASLGAMNFSMSTPSRWHQSEAISPSSAKTRRIRCPDISRNYSNGSDVSVYPHVSEDDNQHLQNINKPQMKCRSSREFDEILHQLQRNYQHTQHISKS